MQFQPMRIFGLLLFVSTPIFMLLGVINSFATSSGLGKAVSFFEVIALGSLAMMIGLAIWERAGLTFNFGPRAAQPAATAAPGTAQQNNPKGGFSA
jgi:hypothetical protein